MKRGLFLQTLGIGCGSLLIALGTSCSNSSSGGGKKHQSVVLRDRLGQPLLAGSTEPYSPRQTCGPCHDVDQINDGFHHQQGRIDPAGNIQVANNFFGDGRDYVRSDGMYGKW